MRVAILTQYFDPEPSFRMNGLTRALVEAGHLVQVLTAMPNWPNGRYYPGYRAKPRHTEERLGAKVVRTYVWPYHGEATSKRLANYGSFAFSALLGTPRLDHFDVLYVYHPPLTIGLPAYFISRRRGVPFIYDVQDIWPEAGVAAGAIEPGMRYRVMCLFARWVYSRARHITVIAPDFKNVLVKQGVPECKISVIPNWADDTIYTPRDAHGVRARYALPERAFLAMYAGNIGSTHGVDCLLEAAARLRGNDNIVFAFVGIGPEYERMLQTKERLSLQNVLFLGYIEPVHMPELLSTADLMLVHVRRSASGAVSLPSRMLSYMACGRPMLVASDGAPRRLVEETGSGVTCEPENPDAIAESISRLAKDGHALAGMGRSGRKAYLCEFTEEIVCGRLVRLIESVAGSYWVPGDS